MTKHNFYIYSNCDFSVKTAATTRMLYYAKALADPYNSVFLISCCSNSLALDKFTEVAPNIFILEQKKLTHKFFSTLRFLKSLHNFSKSREGKNTFLLYPYPYFYLELLTVFYMIFSKKHKVFYELNEVKKYSSNFHEPLSLRRIKYALKTLKHKSRFILMDRLMPFYTGLICISTNIELYGKEYNKNTLRVPILTNPEFQIVTSDKTYIKKGFFNIGFSGSIVPSKENLFEFVDVVKEARQNNYKVAFNLCGTISKKNHKLLIKCEDTEKDLKYYGQLDEKELSSFLAQQDLLVVPRGFTLQNKYGFSTKLSDYLNHKKMVLVTNISDNGLYIKDGVNGFIVEPDDQEMMYDKLSYIIDNFKELEKPIITNALATSKNQFSYKLYRKPLLEFLLR